MSKSYPQCDSIIFQNGSSIAVFDAGSKEMEEFVSKIRGISKQQVDWHYSGGRANLLFIGKRKKVEEAIKSLLPEFKGTLLNWTPQESKGPYRSSMKAPEGAVAYDPALDVFFF